MTMVSPYQVPCPLCRFEHEQLVLESTSTHSPPDLDSRPAPLARGTFIYEAATCPNCGFVFEPRPDYATEFVTDTFKLRALLASDQYRDPKGLPAQAMPFHRASLIANFRGASLAEGWALVRAAWACDDADDAQAATALRVRAVQSLRKAESEGQEIVDPPELSGLVFADLLRRAGRFNEARDACRAAQAAVDEYLRGAVEQELELIDARDLAAHRMRPQP